MNTFMKRLDLSQPRGAVFSGNRTYRYVLWRVWHSYRPARVVQTGKRKDHKQWPLLLYLGLNPSTANEITDDPTIARLTRRAWDGAFGGLLAANLCAFVADDPERLLTAREPVGLWTDEYIRGLAEMVKETRGVVLVGWGQLFSAGRFKFLQERADVVLKMVPEPYCLGQTKDGYPRHPLYIPYSVAPVPYQRKT